MISCIVFDFDDTLVLSEKYKYEAFFEIASVFKDGKEKMEGIFKDPNRGDRFDIMLTFAKLLEPHNQEKALELSKTLIEDYTLRVEKFISTCPEVNGAEKALKALQDKGLQLFINSATPEESLVSSIEKRGWSHFFEKIYGRPNSKVQNLEKISEVSFFTPFEIIMVGDGENDREAAENFGCEFIGITSLVAKFKKPVKLLAKDMEEVAQIILSGHF